MGVCEGAPTPSALHDLVLCSAQFKGFFDAKFIFLASVSLRA
jgi:hypothetical protein